MSPVWGKAAALALLAGVVAIRAPYGSRSARVKVVDDRRTALETAVLACAWIASLAPLAWVFGAFRFADYPLRPVPYAAGVLLMGAGLRLFQRSHADLGANWSITVQLREHHSLVTSGVYARVRHPMYTALLALGVAQALSVPNWVVGPSYLAAMLLVYAARVRAEEKMMLDRFGGEYEAYMRRTGRLLPPL